MGLLTFFFSLLQAEDDVGVDQQDKKVKGDEAPVAGAAGSSSVDVEAQIVKQVEFYFSDSNMPGDKFMKKTADENEGCTCCLLFGETNG